MLQLLENVPLWCIKLFFFITLHTYLWFASEIVFITDLVLFLPLHLFLISHWKCYTIWLLAQFCKEKTSLIYDFNFCTCNFHLLMYQLLLLNSVKTLCWIWHICVCKLLFSLGSCRSKCGRGFGERRVRRDL